MKNKTIHTVTFSPTGTTVETVRSIVKGINGTTGTATNITLAEPKSTPSFADTDLVIVGMPVYGGRLPALAVDRFKSTRGNNTPVVLVVVYGNRHYDDALVELVDLCSEQGFCPVAAGAFLGEHSFSTADLPLSAGRPDAADLALAEKFGEQISLLNADVRLAVDAVSGNRPYKPAMQPAGSATSVNAAICTKCGKCIDVCPTHGMRMTENAAEADPDNCIWCMACERICPVSARSLSHEKVKASAQKLNEFFSERRDAETFLG